MRSRTPLTRLPPYKWHTARVLSRWQRSGSFAASTPATSRKALRGKFSSQLHTKSRSNHSTSCSFLPLRAFRRRGQCQLPRPGLCRCHLLSHFPHLNCASKSLSPRHLDIGAVHQTVQKNYQKWRNPSRRPPGAS
jgi:hypothetical protein